MKSKLLQLFFSIALLALNSHAQVVFNNGSVINAKSGAVVQVNGDLHNANGGTLTVDENSGLHAELIITGNFTNDGVAGGNGFFKVAGNWINNHIFNAGTGSVALNGGAQLITGISTTTFYNLHLEGSGNKTMTLDQTVLNVLNLNDKELLTEQNTMFVNNTNPNAIHRTTGFVSSIGSGALSRNTASTSTYLFPVGSSVGTLRYRPVEITPNNSQPNTFTVRMANVDATTEGFDRAFISQEICATNPLFYHRINRAFGNTPINLSIYYDETEDGTWDGIARWNATLIWQSISDSYNIQGTPFSKATVANWNDFTSTPYILFDGDCMQQHIYIPNIFSPNSDGINDILFARGEGIIFIELSIFNRWGEEIFHTTDINFGWDGTFKGEKCNPGVYVYYINATFSNNQKFTGKGTITLVR